MTLPVVPAGRKELRRGRVVLAKVREEADRARAGGRGRARQWQDERGPRAAFVSIWLARRVDGDVRVGERGRKAIESSLPTSLFLVCHSSRPRRAAHGLEWTRVNRSHIRRQFSPRIEIGRLQTVELDTRSCVDGSAGKRRSHALDMIQVVAKGPPHCPQPSRVKSTGCNKRTPIYQASIVCPSANCTHSLGIIWNYPPYTRQSTALGKRRR